MSEPIKISVYLITLNEEKHLAKVLESAAGADEIVVVDSGSTDNTVEIAESYGARVVYQQWSGFAKQKAYALSLCSHDWVLNLDGDEVLTANAINVINVIKKEISAHPDSAFLIDRDDVFMNQVSKGKSYPFLRIYRKDRAEWDLEKLVHEHVEVQKPHRLINGVSMVHYGYESIEKLSQKIDSYSGLKAQMKYDKGKRFNPIKLLMIFPVMFLKFYIFRLQCKDGIRGFIHSVIDASYFFKVEAKLLELKISAAGNHK